MDPDHDRESRSHPGHGGALARFAGEHAQQKHAQQRTHGNGADGETGLQHGLRMACPDGNGQ